MKSLQVASTSNKEPQTLRTGLQCSLSHFQPWKCSTWWNWWALTVKTSLRGNLFSWGHGVSGMGLPKKLHKLSQPSPTWEGEDENRGCPKKFSFVSPPLCTNNCCHSCPENIFSTLWTRSWSWGTIARTAALCWRYRAFHRGRQKASLLLWKT